MSFGLNDKDWTDPEEKREPEHTCGDCEHFRMCCGCGAGWCMKLLEPTHRDDYACEEAEVHGLQ
mgnify:CR=1 FL=1|jgi:hypothetical protein|nr:MAG TPA: hypothetical protein [Caudoviricetes sp.]